MATKWDLETRLCECGCGRTFRCLPHSSARFFSITHDPDQKVEPYAYFRHTHDKNAVVGLIRVGGEVELFD